MARASQPMASCTMSASSRPLPMSRPSATSSDAPEISVETNTGDVTGTLLTPKTFEADTDTGKVKLPQSEPGGRCRLKSDTGDFVIGIAG